MMIKFIFCPNSTIKSSLNSPTPLEFENSEEFNVKLLIFEEKIYEFEFEPFNVVKEVCINLIFDEFE